MDKNRHKFALNILKTKKMKKLTSAVKEASAKINASKNKKGGKNFNRRFGVPVFLLMSLPTIPNKVVAALDMPKQWSDRVTKARAIYTACNTNPNITIQPADLATLLSKVGNLETAHNNVELKLVGAVGVRKVAWEDLNNYLTNDLKWLIQGAANATPASAIIIIESCLYKVKSDNKPSKQDFAVLPTTTPGTVKFVINVKQMAAGIGVKPYMLVSVVYMQSVDNIHWTIVTAALGSKSKVTVAGYEPGKQLYFKAQGTFTKGRLSAEVVSGAIIIQ